MYRAFNTAVSGLQANQTRMEVIGNNIANVNTTGFKANRATFEEQFAQTISGASEPTGTRGGRNPFQVGLGTRVASIDTIHTQGAIGATGKNTDIAVQGTGFLVLEDGNNNRLYTRDGNLGIDADGRLVSNTGLRVQGFQADSRGVINSSGSVTDLVIGTNRTYPPQASSKVDVAGNLFRPARLTAEQAYAHAIQNGAAVGVAMTGYGNGPGTLQLGTTNNNRLDAGELTINNVSIIGEVPLTLPGDTTQTAMQKMADLINFHRDKTGVLATVKTTSTGGTPTVQIALTALRPGEDQQIVVGGNSIPDITMNNTQLFRTGTTTIQTQSLNTTGQTTAGAISLISGDIVVNGVDIGALPATPTTNTAEQNAQAIIGLINSKTDNTGVTAFSDGNGRISMRSTARDIILTGRTLADGPGPASPTPGGGANVSGLFSGMNRAKNATVLSGTTTDVFDSLGSQHSVGLEFVSDYDVVTDAGGIVRGTRDNGIWNWAASSDEPDVAVLSSDGAAGANVPLRNVNFNENGLLKNFSGRFTLNFLNTDAITSTSIFNFNTNLSPNVAQPQPMTVDVGTVNDTDGLTQFSGATTLTVADQDGYAAGDLANFTFAPDGTVRGVFTNGKILALGRVALASFVNDSGLLRGNLSVGGGGNVYQETPNSGEPRIGMAQGGGKGSIIGGALEGSNVDLSEQFTDMIVTQRAFQANSRTITTADEMLQEILSLRR